MDGLKSLTLSGATYGDDEMPECGQAVSSDAKACPNCGARDPSMSSYITTAIGGCLFLVVVTIVMIKGCDALKHRSSSPSHQQIMPQEQPATTSSVPSGR